MRGLGEGLVTAPVVRTSECVWCVCLEKRERYVSVFCVCEGSEEKRKESKARSAKEKRF